MCEFNPYKKILLNLFDVSKAFQDNIWVVYTVWHIFALMLNQILSWNVFEISNKLNKIWLKKTKFSIFKSWKTKTKVS